MHISSAYVIIFLAAITGISGGLFGTRKPLSWETLRVTWGPLPISGKYFDTMPLTIQAAEASGWRNVSFDCMNTDIGYKFFGWRYVYGQDTSMSLLYNANGVISGIQMNPKVSELLQNGNDYKFESVSMFQRNSIAESADDVYSLTAYFTNDPASICHQPSARTMKDLSENGIGTELYFQDGDSCVQGYTAPRNKASALTSGWNKNNCFPGMGWHTWYKSELLEANNCTVDRPVFLLYNKQDELLGFGFNVVGTANSPNERYEHPPLLAVKTIMGNPPQCLIDRQKKVGLTTMHVFFVDFLDIPKADCINPF